VLIKFHGRRRRRPFTKSETTFVPEHGRLFAFSFRDDDVIIYTNLRRLITRYSVIDCRRRDYGGGGGNRRRTKIAREQNRFREHVVVRAYHFLDPAPLVR